MIKIVIFIIVSIGLSLYDIWLLNKKQLKKEIYFYIGFMTLAIAFGVFYFWNEYQVSFAEYILDLIGASHE